MKGEKYLFVVSGPSGTGKDTVVAKLLGSHPEIEKTVSATTRTPREGERDGVDYHFIHADRFRNMIAEDAFLEYAEYVGNFYGTPMRLVDEAMEQGKDVLLDIEIQGAMQVCAKRPETVRIFIAPPSWKELERRLDEVQHDYTDEIVSTMHVHLDHHNCLEILALKGRGKRVYELADRLLGLRGVKHGELTCAATKQSLGL